MGVLVILAGWLFFSVGLYGWGWGVARVAALGLGVKSRDCAEPNILFWLGFVAALAVAQVWNFFGPINGNVAIVFWSLGCLGFADYLRIHKDRWKVWTSRRRIHWYMLAIPLLVLLARESTYGPSCWDSGFYHFSSIKWAQSYPVVPGLGNLMGHLAFNQSYFLFAALLDVGPLREHGFQFVNSLLCAAFACQGSVIVYRAWISPLSRRPDIWMHLLMLPAVFFEMSSFVEGRRISSPTPDLALVIIEAVLVLRFVSFLFPREPEPTGREWQLFVIIVLGTAAITIKLSAAVFVSLLVLAAIALELSRRANNTWRRTLFISALAASLLLVPWMARGVMLSGYPAFPSRMGGLPVDWKIPAEDVQHMKNLIVGWGRNPSREWASTLGHWGWVGEWSRRTWASLNVQLFVYSFFAALGLWIVTYLRNGRWWKEGTYQWLLPIVPALAAIAFWFVTAPAPRFLGIIPWILPVWLAVWSLQAWRDETLQIARKLGVPAICLVCAVFAATSLPETTTWSYGRLGLAMIPKEDVETKKTNSGLEVRVSAKNGRIWAAKLPATTFFNPDLELRKRKIVDGFRAKSPFVYSLRMFRAKQSSSQAIAPR